jgi:hypothetical protein
VKKVGGKPTKPTKGLKKGGGKGSGKQQPGQLNRQQNDGRYFKINGTQVCFAWNRSHTGCTEICPHARVHRCENCTEVHRAIGCNIKPTIKKQ